MRKNLKMYNSKTMIGITEKDNDLIKIYTDREIQLYIDIFGFMYDNSGRCLGMRVRYKNEKCPIFSI